MAQIDDVNCVRCTVAPLFDISSSPAAKHPLPKITQSSTSFAIIILHLILYVSIVVPVLLLLMSSVTTIAGRHLDIYPKFSNSTTATVDEPSMSSSLSFSIPT